MADSWLTPFCNVWDARYGAGAHAAVVRQLARYVAPLTKHHSADVISAHLTKYLAVTPPTFVNIAKFAATFGEWTPVEPRAVEAANERGPAVVNGWLSEWAERASRP